jgi:PAS domain S-box-containing protein
MTTHPSLTKADDPIPARSAGPAEQYRPEDGRAEIPPFSGSVLDALGICIATLSQSGTILAVNRAWRRLAAQGRGLGQVSIGDNYLIICDQAAAAGHPVAGEVARGIRAVMAGNTDLFLREFLPCMSSENCWFDLRVAVIEGDTAEKFLVSLEDSSQRHRALDAVRESVARHEHAERIARLGHWRLVYNGGDWTNGAIVYSEQARVILGLDRELSAHTLEDIRNLIHPEDRAKVFAAYEAPTNSYVVDYRIIRPDGALITIQETGESVYDPDGNISIEFGTIQDITEQRRDADQLRLLNEELEALVSERTATLTERESQLRRAQALAQIGHYTWHKARETYAGGSWQTGLSYSPAAAAIFGVMPEELAVGDEDYVARFVHPDDRAFVLHAYQNTFLERLRKHLPLEYRIVRPDQSVRHVVEIIEQKAGDEENLIAALGMIQDITARKETELALRESETRMQAFMDNAPFIMSTKDTAGRLTMINREGVRSYEESTDRIFGHRTDELLPNSAGFAIAEMSREVLATGNAVAREVELPGRTRYQWSLEIEFPIRDAADRIVSIGGFAVDITEQKKAELALRESEARLRAIFDHAPITLSLRDLDGRYVMVNDRLLEALDRPQDQVIGHRMQDFYPPETALAITERIQRVIHNRQSETYEAHLSIGDAEVDALITQFPITNSAGDLTGVGSISLDITKQRAAEAALQQAQKMEVVGQLTGGIAHDFNNLLGAIIGNLDLLAQRLGQDHRSHELLNRVIAAADSGASLIQRLLAFSRRQTLQPRLLDVNKQVEGMRLLVHHTLPPGVSVAVQATARHSRVRVDPVQLETALLNLVINASDAMPEGGVVTISTEDSVKSQEDGQATPPENYLAIAVRDTGTGMSRATLARVFEPFFTTKPVGKGTGLGLSMVHGFVTQSGGMVKIDSAPGKGTMVTILLPVSDDAGDAAMADSEARPADAAHPATIMVVDDDLDLRAFMELALNRLGYRCLMASDADSALRLFAEDPEIGLILTDVNLPGGKSGVDLALAARACRPAARVIYISGSPDMDGRANASLVSGDSFLQKPFHIDELGRTIALALKGEAP